MVDELTQDIEPDAADVAPALEGMLRGSGKLFIEQHWRAWYEILLNWEQRNEYSVSNGTRLVASVVEQATGLANAIARVMLGSHRPFEIAVLEPGRNEPMLEFHRKFFFLFSDLEVQTPAGRVLGRVQRRFGLAYKLYDLHDEEGVFARIAGPMWRPWTFRIVDADNQQVALITKKWSGLLREMNTDADNFLVDFGDAIDWTLPQRAVIFAAAMSIDFDFFENNQNR